ncbi:hypothetical protein Pyn_40420 [Prunus yedoensis var. nudiflora]|uniref:Uncharacterized protein n=1 Tax=Prunus yedoensis var. nudiflora TaxID=2094558 RepID=A0A314V0D0_PRUYE|nr:hypothetical protein Pyn_40420 [Prunus yedoensis var. nudiflora]
MDECCSKWGWLLDSDCMFQVVGRSLKIRVEFECRLSPGIRRRVEIFKQGTVLELQNQKGIAGSSDSLKERVKRIENFLGTISGDEIECVVTQMEDLNAKMVEIERVFRELKASIEKKVTNVLGDMDGLGEAIAGKLKSVKNEQGGKRHLANKPVNKGKEIKVVLDGAKGKEYKDKKKFSGYFFANDLTIDGGVDEGNNLQASPMVLLNSLRFIPPKDPLGEDAIEQPVIGVIEVFVDMFAMEPSKISIDAFLVHGNMLIEAIENIESNWDLNYGLEEMQFAALAHYLGTLKIYLLDRKFVSRTCVLHSHMYSTGTIRDDFGIYLDVLDEFNFKLAYMSMRHRDFEELFDELMANATQSVSSALDPSESESEDEPG